MVRPQKRRKQANKKESETVSCKKIAKETRSRNESKLVKKVFGPLWDRLKSRWLSWDNRPMLGYVNFKDPNVTDEMISYLGSSKRLEIARKLEEAYYRDHSIENYLKFRRSISDVEIDAEYFFDHDQFSYLQRELTRQGVDTECLYGVFDGFEPDIDELCLQLIELLVAKNRLPISGPGYINQRKNAISDSFINYLIVIMVERIAWKGQYGRSGVLPQALLVLIRERLCGSNPDAFEEAHKSNKNSDFVISLYQAVDQLREGASVRTLAKAMGTSKSKLDRFLKEAPEIRHYIEYRKRMK